MTIYRFNVRSTFKHGFNFTKIMNEVLSNPHIKKPIINITNDRDHPYIMMIEFKGFLNVKEVSELNTLLRHHRYGPPTTSTHPTTPATPIHPTTPATPTHPVRPATTSDKLIGPPNFADPNNNSVSGILTTLEDIVVNSSNGMLIIDGYSGIDIGNITSNGPVNIATTSNTREISIGNSASGTNISVRYGGSLSFTQYNETVLSSDTTIELDFGSILSGIVYGNPIEDTTLNVTNAQNIIYYEDGIQLNDGYDFSIINLSATNTYTLNADSSFTVIGNPVVSANTSGSFRIKITSTATDSESCTLFRLS